MRRMLPALALTLLSGCAAAAPPYTGGLAGPVTYEVSSWGRLLFRWRVNPDGSGEFWRGTGLGKGEGEVSKYRMRLEPAALREFIAAAEPIRSATAKEIDCQHEITDMPYGSIAWDYPDAKQSYAFDGGCISPAADRVAKQIRALHDTVEQQAAIEPQPYAVDKPAN